MGSSVNATAELSLATLCDPGKNASLIPKSSMNRPQGKSRGAKSRTGRYTIHRNKNHETVESDSPIGANVLCIMRGWLEESLGLSKGLLPDTIRYDKELP